MTEQELVESVASEIHMLWQRRLKDFLGRCKKQPVKHDNGNLANIMFAAHDLVVTSTYLQEVDEMLETPYKHLSERDKKNIRSEVIYILPIIHQYAEENEA